MKQTFYPGTLPFQIDNVGLTLVSRDAGYAYSFRSGRTSHTFIFVRSGKIRYTFPDPALPPLVLEASEAAFFPQGACHEAEYLADHSQLCVLTFDVVSGSLPPRFDSPFRVPEDITLPHFSAENKNSPLYLAARVYEIMDGLCRQEDVPKPYRCLLPALEELKIAYVDNQKVAYYAALCNMSETSFRRLFTACTGFSPIEYRNLARLAEARKMIDSGEYTTAEAAEIAGFTNLSFFYRIYKRFYGQTPGKQG